MSYKCIAVHVDHSKHVRRRIEVAIGIALVEDAHLVGIATTGNPADVPTREARLQRESEALDEFERLVRKAGLNSFERRLVEDEAANGVSAQGLYCDLIVLGRGGAEPSPAAEVDLLQYVALNCGCPVLIFPDAALPEQPGQRVLVAWNASKPAVKAIRSAMPLLKHAPVVEVAIVNSSTRPDAHGEEPGADIATYLARHGIEVEVVRRTVDALPGDALLSLAAERSADLLVMGCVAHPRYPGVQLGGATRSVLESTSFPVLMAH